MTLGPVTDARFAEAFRCAAVVSKKVAADLLGIDGKTVDALTEASLLRSIPRGARHRGYTELDLRSYLLTTAMGVERAAPSPKMGPSSRWRPSALNFTERPSRRPAAKAPSRERL